MRPWEAVMGSGVEGRGGSGRGGTGRGGMGHGTYRCHLIVLIWEACWVVSQHF